MSAPRSSLFLKAVDLGVDPFPSPPPAPMVGNRFYLSEEVPRCECGKHMIVISNGVINDQLALCFECCIEKPYPFSVHDLAPLPFPFDQITIDQAVKWCDDLISETTKWGDPDPHSWVRNI